MAYRTKPIVMAIRMCSNSNATTTDCGSTTIGRNRTTSGIRTTSSCSVSETIFFYRSRPRSERFFFSGLFRFFFQPPNILPISSSLSATSSHCLLEIIFPSQATETRNFKVSKTKIHSDTLSNFLSFSGKWVNGG